MTVLTNAKAARLNARIRDQRTQAGLVGDEVTATGSDGLPMGRGDVIQARKNDTEFGVANRQQWVSQQVELDGTLWAVEEGNDRKLAHSVRLPATYVTEHTHLG